MVLCILEKVRQGYAQDDLVKRPNCLGAKVLNTIADVAAGETCALFQPQTLTQVSVDMDTNQDYNQPAYMMDGTEAETTSAGSVNEKSALEEDTEPIREQDDAVITPTPAPLIMAQVYNWDSVTPIPWSSSSGSSSGDSDTSSLLGDSMDEGYTWTSLLVPNPDRPDSPRLILRRVPAPASPSGSPSGGSDTSSLLGDTMEDIPWASLLAPLPRPISPLREPVPPHGRDLEMAQGYNWDSVTPIPWSSSSGSSSGDSDTSSLLGDSMDEGYTWTSLLVPNPDRPDSPRLILRRVPAPASPSGSPSGGSDTSSLLEDTMEDIPWASLLAPLPRPISPLREPVPPRGRDPEMDEGYTWTSLLVPNPDRPDSPRLILRRAPASPSGSPSGGSDMSSLLEDTMEDIPWASLLAPLPRPISPLREPVPPRGRDPEMEDIPWASLLAPLPRPISPLREPVPPRGRDPEMAQGYNWDSVTPIPWSSSSGSSSGDSDTSSLLGDSMDEGYTWTSLLVPNPDRPDSPRLILRRVPAPASPSGSPSGGSDTSSLLEDTALLDLTDFQELIKMEDIPWASLLTPLPRPISPLREPVPPHGRDLEMDEGYTWTSLLVPNPDRPDSPRLILRRVPAPASPSGSPSSGSDTSSLLGDTMEDIPWASLLAPLPRPISPLREPVPPCGRDPEVGASDPPPAPGKPVEAGPSKGPVAPGKPKSLPTGPKPRFGQLFIYSITQKSTPLNPVLDDVRIYQIYCISPPPHPVFLPCEDLS
ncbi:hypothetical protein ABVT39_001948 [Epinephelus coioides]